MTTPERIEVAKRTIQEIDSTMRVWLAGRTRDRRQWTPEDFAYLKENAARRNAVSDELRQAMEEAMMISEVKPPTWRPPAPVFQGGWVVTVVKSYGVRGEHRERIFKTKEEADAYYGEMIAAQAAETEEDGKQ